VNESVLSRIPLFAALAPGDRLRLATVCSIFDVAAGTTLVQEGDVGDTIYAIVSGSARVAANGKVIRTLGPGQLFAEIIAGPDGPTGGVIATTPMCLIAVLKRDAWRFEAQLPRLAA